jgi:hypothetical protein
LPPKLRDADIDPSAGRDPGRLSLPEPINHIQANDSREKRAFVSVLSRENRPTGLGKRHRCREAVGARPDDDGIGRPLRRLASHRFDYEALPPPLGDCWCLDLRKGLARKRKGAAIA